MVKMLHDLAGVSLQRSDVIAVRAAWSASRSRVKRPGFWLCLATVSTSTLQLIQGEPLYKVQGLSAGRVPASKDRSNCGSV
jgi:hypothetical protein